MVESNTRKDNRLIQYSFKGLSPDCLSNRSSKLSLTNLSHLGKYTSFQWSHQCMEISLLLCFSEHNSKNRSQNSTDISSG